jgi:hypothetical protein
MKYKYCPPLAALVFACAFAPLAHAHTGHSHPPTPLPVMPSPHGHSSHGGTGENPHTAAPGGAGENPHAAAAHDGASPERDEEMTAKLVVENSQLRIENQKLKAEVSMNDAVRETEKAKTRVAFIVAGIVFLAAGLYLRYAPGKANDGN